jgi:serine/threonine protein kinase
MDQDILGEGSYGQVIAIDGLAIKKFSKINHVIQEAFALFYLEDTNYCVHIEKIDLYKKEIGMQLFDCSFRDYISKDPECSDVKRMAIFKDILLGLIELHDRRLIHGDLKPGNVLISINPLKAVLGDCGFVSIESYAKNERTAAPYREMEIEHSYKHDIYSYGMCMIAIMGKVHLNKQYSYSKAARLCRGSVMNDKFKKLVLRMINQDKTVRPTAREILDILYNQDYPRWSITREFFNSYNVPIVDEEQSVRLFTFMTETCSKYKLGRSGKAYALLLYILGTNPISKEYDTLFAIVMLLIVGSVYSFENKFTIDSAMSLAKKNGYKVSERAICKIAEGIITNNLYAKMFFCPTSFEEL